MPKTTTQTKADPVLAALRRHQKLDRIWLALSRAEDEGRATEGEVRLALNAAEDAAWSMAETRPTTIGGCSALLSYATVGPITGIFELGECRWTETAIRTAVQALARIARAT